MLTRLHGWLLFTLILGLAAALRLTALDADPPRVISGGPTPNEGLYAQNARNLVVEGTWRLDDWDSRIVHPVASALQVFGFQLAGVGLAQARLLSVALSLLSLLLLFILLRSASGQGTALLATLFLGLNPVFLVYSRQANPASLGVFLMLLTIWLWRLSRRHVVFVLLAGLSLAVTAIVENGPHNVFFLAAAVLATFMVRLQAWKMPWAGTTRRRVRRFWWAAVLGVVVWLFVLVLPNRGDFLEMLNTPLSRARWGNIPVNLFMAPFIFGRLIRWMPLTCFIALLYFLVFARSLFGPIARHRTVSETRIWVFAWLVTAPIFIALRDDRYLGVMALSVPPLCVAAAEALVLVLSLTQLRKPRLDIIVVLGLLALVTWFTAQGTVHLAFLNAYGKLPGFIARHQFRSEFIVVVLIAVPLTILVSRLWLRWKKFTLDISPGAARTVFAILLGGILLLNTRAILQVLDSGRDFQQAALTLSRLPRSSVVAGSWAPVLSLDSGWRGMVVWPGLNDRDPFERHGITHLLLQRGSNEDLGRGRAWKSNGQDVGGRARRLESLTIDRTTLDLYAIEREKSP